MKHGRLTTAAMKKPASRAKSQRCILALCLTSCSGVICGKFPFLILHNAHFFCLKQLVWTRMLPQYCPAPKLLASTPSTPRHGVTAPPCSSCMQQSMLLGHRIPMALIPAHHRLIIVWTTSERNFGFVLGLSGRKWALGGL